MGIRTVINSDGTRGLIWIMTDENLYWQELWRKAWDLMPRHSATMLCKLLGYKVPECRKMYTQDGKAYWLSNGCNNRIYTNYRRGSKPRLPQQQRLLKLLGGPHGRTMMRAIALNRGIELE